MTTRPYELLARFGADGTIAGVSVRTITTVGGRDYESDPSPLSGANDPAFADFAQAFAATAVAERDALAADKAEVELQLATVTAERDSLLERVADRDSLSGQVSTLTLERDDAVVQVESLTSQVAQLTAELEAIRNPPGPDLSTVDGAKQFITAQRYDNETAGFSVGGQFISTERDEIGHWFPRYFNAYQWTIGDAATRAGNPAGLYPFKPKNHAPTILTAAQLLRVYDCMTWFINSCFAVEAAAYARLDAGDAIADVIDSLEWPQSSFDWQPPAAPTE